MSAQNLSFSQNRQNIEINSLNNEVNTVLLEYGLKNFFSFKEGVTISFKLDANCPTSVSNGRNFAAVLCIKGANGAGKTNILRGLSFLGFFVAHSFKSEPGTSIKVSPFFSCKDPIELYAEFMVKDVTYLYEVSMTERQVKRETIYRTISKKTKILERVRNELKHCAKPLRALNKIKLRDNASIVSTAHQYELTELEDIYDFFINMGTNVRYSGFRQISTDLSTTSATYKKHEKIFRFARDFIKACDIGISDIQLIKQKKERPESDETIERLLPVFIHPADESEHMVTQVTESSGTKALFQVLGLYKAALQTGGVLALDEFDIHLHPLILRKLVELFVDPETNKKNAQLIFSTHDAEILNYLGRYRTYLVNKTNNEAFAYRLDQIPGNILRNDRPILPIYNDGKIGGIPQL